MNYRVAVGYQVRPLLPLDQTYQLSYMRRP